jgi:hypothetical protein
LLDDLLTQSAAAEEPSRPEQFGKAFEQALIACGAFFKDISFEQEDEWRIVTDVRNYRDPKETRNNGGVCDGLPTEA